MIDRVQNDRDTVKEAMVCPLCGEVARCAVCAQHVAYYYCYDCGVKLSVRFDGSRKPVDIDIELLDMPY